MSSVVHRLEARAERHPDRLLFAFLDVQGDVVERYSYGSFVDRVREIGGWLRACSGLRPGDRAIVLYPPGLEMIAAVFGCARAGIIPVPLPSPSAYGWTAAMHRLAHVAKDCGAATVLCSSTLRGDLAERFTLRGRPLPTGDIIPADKWISTDAIHGSDYMSLPPTTHPVCLLQYTSGSTSDPKGVLVTHANVIHNAAVAVDHDAPITVTWLPQHHDMGLLGYYLYIALSGGTTYGFAPATFVQRPALWLQTISAYRATASSAPNFAYDYCLKPSRVSAEVVAQLDLTSLRYLMAAAEPIQPATYTHFLRRFEPCGLRRQSFFVAYGLAENTLAVTNYGRTVLSVNKTKLSRRTVLPTARSTDVGVAKQLMSCGRVLPGIDVRVVDPDTRTSVHENAVGEIWVAGESVAAGYWNDPERTNETFCARLTDDSVEERRYLRTGDMGFLYDGELYVCGRLKDMIVIRGQNVYPQDIELVAEQTSSRIRAGYVAAFATGSTDDQQLTVLAEAVSRRDLPDPAAIARAIREVLGVNVAVVAIVPARALPRTSSGKNVRHLARARWTAGEVEALRLWQAEGEAGPSEVVPSPMQFLLDRYGITRDESATIGELGIDSIDLVSLLHGVKDYLEDLSLPEVSEALDLGTLQRLRVGDVCRGLEQLRAAPAAAAEHLQSMLRTVRARRLDAESAMMRRDRLWHPKQPPARFTPSKHVRLPRRPSGCVLLTGPTGFLGPFLLRSLLECTSADVHVIVRAPDTAHARGRIAAALARAHVPSDRAAVYASRVRAVCGDLTLPRFGLPEKSWHELATHVDAIYHNGADVNYIRDYGAMRPANVIGTQEVLQLACAGPPKEVNYVSTTFVFGWARKSVLMENDANDAMERLDFGYSQTKWVAEQNVLAAGRLGLPVRVFRPSLITPPLVGSAETADITMRLIAFMVKHGITPDTHNQVSLLPADTTARNIVAIGQDQRALGGVFHVTRDDYANMMHVTDIIARRTGRCFEALPLGAFVASVIRRCTPADPLFPLLDFLVGSVDNIAAMEFKRYDNAQYRAARDASPDTVPEPSLDETVEAMLAFMARLTLV